jgi:hypothetical protein
VYRKRAPLNKGKKIIGKLSMVLNAIPSIKTKRPIYILYIHRKYSNTYLIVCVCILFRLKVKSHFLAQLRKVELNDFGSREKKLAQLSYLHSKFYLIKHYSTD